MNTKTDRKPYGTKLKTGWVLIPCNGEAHQNGFIDNCGGCAPRWGEIEVHARSYKLGQNDVRRELWRLKKTHEVLLEALKLLHKGDFENHAAGSDPRGCWVCRVIAQAEGKEGL